MKVYNISMKDRPRNNITDKFGDNSIKGRVTIHGRKQNDYKYTLLQDKSNLILYRGRNWLMQKAFNISMDVRPNWKNNFISWFSLGRGGCVPNEPLVPNAPQLPDIGLSTPAVIDGGNEKTIIVGDVTYVQFDDGYPKFIADPDIDNSTLDPSGETLDPLDGGLYYADKYLIGLIRVTIGGGEANNGVEVDSYQDLNEACLYTSPSLSREYPFVPDDMVPLARVTFPTIRKQQGLELVFSWYIYF